MQVGDKVAQSPVGPGIITGATMRGYPQVNDVAVAWLETESGEWFNPNNLTFAQMKESYSSLVRRRHLGVRGCPHE